MTVRRHPFQRPVTTSPTPSSGQSIATSVPQQLELKKEAPRSFPDMQYIHLGGKLKVSRLGLGCMAMSEFYGQSKEEECIKVIRRAFELGINFFDTADIYGFGANEELLAKALQGIPREGFAIATKGGIIRKKDDPSARGVSNKPDYIRACVEASLKRLGTSYIDLYYLHRIDSDTSIKEAMAALVELVKEGKIRHIGLSEADPKIIRRAHKIHPITAVQTEYSLLTRFVEYNHVLKVCRELKIGFVPYSPLGRGFLTGQITRPDDLEEKDYRRSIPRFQAENLQNNIENLAPIIKLAKEKGCTPAQISLAWIFAQGNDLAPIPGTRQLKYLEENVAALSITLSKKELESLNSHKWMFSGERYPQAAMELYQLYSSGQAPKSIPPIISIFKIILATRALKGRDLGRSYTNSKKQYYQHKIDEANPNEINAFFQRLFLKRPFVSQATGRNIATSFFEALLDLGIFDLLFPEMKNSLQGQDRNYIILKIIDLIIAQIEQGALPENWALASFYSQLSGLSGRCLEIANGNRLLKAFYNNPQLGLVDQYASRAEGEEEKPSVETAASNNLPPGPAILTVFDNIWTYQALKERDSPVSISKSKINIYRDQLAACSPHEMNDYIHAVLTAKPFKGRKTARLVANNFFEALKELGILQLLFPQLNYATFVLITKNIVNSVMNNSIKPEHALTSFYFQLIKSSGLDQALLMHQNQLFAAYYGLPQYVPEQVAATHQIMQGLAQQAPTSRVSEQIQPESYQNSSTQLITYSQAAQQQSSSQGTSNFFPHYRSVMQTLPSRSQGQQHQQVGEGLPNSFGCG